jgi:hypothetical protein
VTGAQQHPNILGALSALADLADQYRWLNDLLAPGTPSRRTPHLTPAARAIIARQIRAERADQTATLQAGALPTGGSPAPLRLGVLNAQLAAHATAHDTALRASSHLRTRPMLAYAAATWRGSDGQRFGRAVEYLTVALRLVSPELAAELGADLNTAARLCAQVTGSAPQRGEFAYGPCPACGRRSLESQTVAAHKPALIMCVRPDCRCRGFDCLCRRPGRVPGLRHIWPSTEFGQLARRLGVAA